MAGRRRTRDAGELGESTQRAARPDRRRERLATEWADASTWPERLHAAYEYRRGVRARRQPDEEFAARDDETLAQTLIDSGDRLLARQAREPSNPPKEAA